MVRILCRHPTDFIRLVAQASWEQTTRRDFAAVESRKPVPRSGPSASRDESTCPKGPTFWSAEEHRRLTNRPPGRLLIVSSGERFGFERFPQPQPPTGCGKHRRCQKRFCSCFHASFVDTWERSGQPRCYDCRLQYVETSRAECRAAGCTLFPNECSDVVWSSNPTLL
jgi:hypothetical protein